MILQFSFFNQMIKNNPKPPILFLIEMYLIYHIMLVPGMQCHDSIFLQIILLT